MAARRAGARPPPVAAEVEDRALARAGRPPGPSGRPTGPGQHLEHPPAAGAGRVERPALDQALDRPLVDRAGVDPLAEVPDRLERAAARASAMIASTAAWPTFLTASRPKRIELPADDEAVVGGVDVGRQHLDPHLLAAVDEERHLVLGRHHRGDHRRHVLGRVVGLQVGGAVGDQRVAGGVGLVEGVVGRRRHQRPEVLGDRRVGPRRRRSRRGTCPPSSPSGRASSCRPPCAGRRPRRG